MTAGARRPAPPAPAAWLLRIVTAREDRAFVAADAADEFALVASQQGLRAARRWYWHQALASIGPQLRERLRRVSHRRRVVRPSPRGLLADVNHGARWIRRHPSISVTVVLTLAIASASVLAAFALVESVVLRPLPFPSASRIVSIRVTGPTMPPMVWTSSLPNFHDWRERARAWSAMSAYADAPMRLTGRGDPRQVAGLRVAPGMDVVLGLTPAAGRLFDARDFVAGAHRSVVLTHPFWVREFGADAAVVGRTVSLDEQAFEIVGVLPDTGVSYPAGAPDVWVPLVPRAGVFWEQARGTGWLRVVGRVREDVSLPAATAELSAIAANLAVTYPAENRERTTAELTPIADEIIGPVAPVLVLIGAALAAVMIIACANMASLLSASASSRRREFAVRAAMGASGARLARQIAAESLLLCGAGVAAGFVMAPAVVRAFIAIHPTPLPRAVDAAGNPLLWLAATGLGIAASVALAVPQILHALRSDIQAEMAGATRATGARADRVFRTALVTLQVSLSFVLIVAGAGFLKTLDRLHAVDTGFRSDGVMSFTVSPSPSRFGSGAAALRFYESVVQEIRSIPGVRGAAAAVGVPMTSGGWRFGITPPGATVATLVGVNLTTDEYFETLGIPLLEGRRLTVAEQRSGRSVVVVNEPLARILGAGGSAVGRRLNYSGASWEVVGVVQAARNSHPRDAPMPEVFLPWHLAGARPQAIVVRVTGDPLKLMTSIAARVRALDPSAPIANVARLDDRFEKSIAHERFRASLLVCLATIALALAALGAYSATAYSAARRHREFGIRLALGERPASIWRRAVTAAFVPALGGCGVGLVVSLAGAHWVESLLYGVSARDATTLAATALLLMAMALAAGASSARRASKLNPAALGGL